MSANNPQTKNRTWRHAAQAVAAIAVALAVGLPMGADAATKGGGSVTNSLPTVTAFVSDKLEVNRGGSIVLTATLFDANKEKDIAEVKVHTTTNPDAAAITATRLLDGTQSSSDFDAGGWKFTDATAGNGVLVASYQVTPTLPGTYVFVASVRDEGSFVAGVATVTVTVLEKITLSTVPVKWDGSAEPEGTRWGKWAQLPGATGVASENYIKITNTGTNPLQQVSVDFTEFVLTGADGSETIDINSNIRYACWEDVTPGADSAPQEAGEDGFVFGDLADQGSVLLAFGARGNIIYCTYQLEALPGVLGDQDYEASYTATAFG